MVNVYKAPLMQGVGHADVLFVVQMPGNEADAVPCERLLFSNANSGIAMMKYYR
jgi:hypothetical protein